jgi:hypothetical protein
LAINVKVNSTESTAHLIFAKIPKRMMIRAQNSKESFFAEELVSQWKKKSKLDKGIENSNRSN